MPEMRFFTNEADIDEGLGDAGIETFRDSPYASVARECAQNSSDARAEDPVTVSFDLLEIDATELPPLDSIRSAIDSCLEKANAANIEKEIEFFRNARSVLAGDRIKILRIEDSNTKGLTGPCTQGTAFHSLLKGSGVSVKDDPTSGGSFGIGKNAAFAVSDVQTVFYSTCYFNPDSGQNEFLCQGKSVLVSHTDASGSKRLATGYWGEESYQPVSTPMNVPDWLRRSEIGTSIFSVGCREAENWELGLAAALIQNFFCAIHRDEMTFRINGGETVIDKESLLSLFNDKSLRQAAIDNNQVEDFDISRSLYECLIAVESREETLNIPDLGEVNVRVLVSDGLPKKVCFVRNGMLITDNLDNFGEKFRRFRLYKDFVALVEPVNSVVNTHLKKLENPKHNEFSAERLPDAGKRSTMTRAMEKLGKQIRNVIKSQTLEKPMDSVAIDELSEFFADEVDPEKVQDPNAVEENPETYRYKPQKTRPPKELGPGKDHGGSEGGSGGGSGSGGDRAGEGGGSGGGTGGVGDRSGGKVIRLQQTRNLLGPEDPSSRILIFTPGDTGLASLKLFATGINTPERIPIVETDNGEVVSGAVELWLVKDSRQKLVVRLQEAYDGPIEIAATSVRREGEGNET